MLGELAVLDDEMQPLPMGEPGTLWFKTATEFSYHNDPEKTAESTSSDGSMTTVGDVGYVDADGFLYLTDRKTFMIISGGVNIYPQECEDLLISHPKIEDAAVFGVPNTDLGEEVKAVVQPITGVIGDDKLTEEILGYLANTCRDKRFHGQWTTLMKCHACPQASRISACYEINIGDGQSRIV